MRLRFRPGEAGDLEHCFAQLGHRFAYDAYDRGLRSRVPGLWRGLLETGSIVIVIVDDLDRPADARAVGLGASVFVSDDFVQEAESRLPPYARAQLMERILQGSSPVLNPRQIQSAADGLNLFFIEDMLGNQDLGPLELQVVRTKAFEAGLALYRCYPLKRLTSEVYGEESRAMLSATGLHLRRDYAGFFGAESEPASTERPYLVGLTRDEARAWDGTAASMFFQYTPKRFSFRRVEQELLRRAVTGETDEELADSLGVSLSAVKKRWRTVYDRVWQSDPGLLPAEGLADRERHSRGREQRRHLLNYLREHPEELQANAP